MMIGSFGYLLEGLSQLTFIDSAALGTVIVGLLVVGPLAELGLAFWLIIKGFGVPATAAIHA